MSNFRIRRQSEGQDTASFHRERQHSYNVRPGQIFMVRPNVTTVRPNKFQAGGSAGGADGVHRPTSPKNNADGSERKNNVNSQNLLRNRNAHRTNLTKADAQRWTPIASVAAEIRGPTSGTRSRPIKPNVRATSSRAHATGSTSEYGHNHSSSVVTLSSLKHTPTPTNSTAFHIEKTRKTPTVRKDRNRTMSYNNYGKVSNPARPVGQASSDPSGHPQEAQGGSNPDSNTPQRHGSYTLITPNSIKRNKVLTQASKEAADYQSYKESKRVNFVKTAPQTVGGTKSEEEVRRQREKEARDKKYEMIMKRRRWEEEKRAREEAEYREKKERAREQTRRNQQRREDRQHMWKEDHRRTNEAFLRRLEQQQK